MPDTQISTLHPILDDQVIPKRDDAYTLSKTACCYFLCNEHDEKVLKLNDTSALVWSLSTGEWTVGDLITALGEQFPDQGNGIAKDVYRTLDELALEQVLELTE